MRTTLKTGLAICISFLLLSSCGSVPPEFVNAMEKEREGIALLKKRHQQSIKELAENWYEERLNRLIYIKQIEVNKITMSVNDPSNNQSVEVIKKAALEKIDKQFSEAVTLTNKIRNLLIDGYSDAENWDKLVKLNSTTLKMTRSLTKLNAEQRSFYAELVGKNLPFPSDLINETTRNLLKN